MIRDREHTNAVTILMPSGRKLRLTEYQDGRVRVRFARMGPVLLQECYVTGPSQDVILSVVPEGWVHPDRKNSPPPSVSTPAAGQAFNRARTFRAPTGGEFGTDQR